MPGKTPAPIEIVPEALLAIRDRTPARILAGRVGSSYDTRLELELRRDHAFAVDAVHAEIDLSRDLGADAVHRWRLFEVRSQAADKEQYLLRPDLGRRFGAEARELVLARCPPGADFQVVIGDGLSVLAVARQAPALLPLLEEGTRRRGWRFGQPIVIRYCRVGILNEIGDLLRPWIVVLLIGERPGLATAESLSAYLAFQPKTGDTDARRNLISNIHARGVGHEEAARRILALADQMRRRGASGVGIREELEDTPQLK